MIKQPIVKSNLKPFKYLFYLLTGICLLLMGANIIKLLWHNTGVFSFEAFYNLVSYTIYFMFLLLIAGGLKSYSKMYCLQPSTVMYLNWLKVLVPVLTILQIALTAYNINALHYTFVGHAAVYDSGYRAGYYSGFYLKGALLPNMGFIIISALLILLANLVNFTLEIKEEQNLTI